MSYIDFEQKDGVGIVRFNKPEILNALSTEGVRESLAFFKNLAESLSAPKEPELLTLLLTGEGKAFISGADVKEMLKMGWGEASQFSELGNKLMTQIERFPIPVIAAVNGYALGGGFELALSADFIYAAANARFGLPEVTLGIFPGFGGIRRLSWRIGTARAKELLYTGQLITAQEAFDLGIVNKVVPAEHLLEHALSTAYAIGKAGRSAIRAAKRRTNEGLLLESSKAMKVEAEQFGQLFTGSDPSEGMSAMLEKRSPHWTTKEG